MGYKFNPPPNWPAPPPGWAPSPGWRPPPEWPAPPPGWQVWLDDTAPTPSSAVASGSASSPRHVYLERQTLGGTRLSQVRHWTQHRKIGVAILGLIVVAIVAIHVATEQSPGQHACEVLRASLNATTNAAETSDVNELASIAASGSVGGQLGTDLATWNNNQDATALGAVAQDCQDDFGMNVYPPQ